MDKKIINTFDTDYKFEVFVTSLIKNNHDPDIIHIIRDGIFRRAVSKDIEKIRTEKDDELKEHIYIHVNREGIYDMIPEGLFHKSTYKSSYRDIQTDVEKALDEIKIHREQEFFARRFFQLFEQALDKEHVEIYISENRYEWSVNNRDFVDTFLSYWPILKKLQIRQALAFMYIIPLLSTVRLNYEEIGESISFILDVPVKIKEIKQPVQKADNQFESVLGKVHLGIDLVLGNSFDDGSKSVLLTIGPLSGNRMRGFLETAFEYNILIELLKIFLEEDIYFKFDFKLDKEDSVFILSDENHQSYLGINTFI